MPNQDEGIPSNSEDGLAARAIFFDEFNDINVFVEDADQENLYHEILTRWYPTLKVEQILPLGGKINVLRQCRGASKKEREKAIYILDKDFDDLLGNREALPNLIYLDRYSIENYLLEEAAVHQIALESEPKKKREEIEAQLQYAKVRAEAEAALGVLFRLFFAVQKLDLGLPNCDTNPEEYCLPRALWKVNDSAVQDYEKKVLESALKKKAIKSDAELTQLLEGAFGKRPQMAPHISGKFLLKMTFHLLRKKAGLGNDSIDSLRFRLAKNCRLVSLRSIKAKIDVVVGKRATV